MKNEIRSSVAINLEILTNRFIDLDKSLFKFSWKRIIPLTGFFEAIDYKSLLITGKNLVSDIANRSSNIISLQESMKNENVFQEEFNFISACIQFCEYLQKLVISLNQILEKLDGRTKDLGSYSKTQYDNDLASYDQLKKEMAKNYDLMALTYQKTLAEPMQ